MTLLFERLQRRPVVLRRQIILYGGKRIAVAGAAAQPERQDSAETERQNKTAEGAHGGARSINNGDCRA